MFRCGLVVGKFSPLHRGHELLIETALQRCEHLILLSYSDPEFAGCSAEQRERWLARLYPQTTRVVVSSTWLAARYGSKLTMPCNDAPDDEHRAFVDRLLREQLKVEVDAVFTSEAYGEGFAAYLQNSAGSSRTITHVLVDAGRIAVPISGRTVREDVHLRRAWLNHVVYGSFVRRVAILGGESSGKSTLAHELAAAMGTQYCAEYGRELWDERSGRLEFDDLLQIALTQIDREEQLAGHSDRYLICDTTPLTTLFYSQELFGRVAPELVTLASRSYAYTILCKPDFPFHQDGTRFDAAFRSRQHDWYVNELHDRRVAYLDLGGDLPSRIRDARQFLR